MKLHYTVTEQAYLDFSIYHAEQSESLSKLARRYRLLFPALISLIGVGFCGFMTWRFGVRVFPFAYLAGCLALSALWYAFYPRLHRSSMKKRIKAYVAEGNGKEFIGSFTLELLDDRRFMKDADGVTTAVPYDRIGKMVENKGCLYIYIGSMTAIIIPLDTFGSEEAYREFRDSLAEKVRTAKEEDADQHQEKQGCHR